jgi:hypothetical protein
MNEFEQGDHIMVDRLIYQHHGVYVGDDMVIHYTQDGVKLSSLGEFSKGWRVIRYEHSNMLPRDEIVKRAYERLGEDEYNIITKNCEHFACYCCIGKRVSKQVLFHATSILGSLISKLYE